ncbi:MAG: hypothetical protein OXK82_08210 [Deltaproteobacteria bacterium]|nr:hypothetical protein [Deltaproteobacteria bacterium]
MAKVWMIRGADGGNPIYKKSVPVECFSDEEMIVLLQRLASRHLELDEVVASSLPKGRKGRMTHLDVPPAGPNNRAYWTPGSPYYEATVVEAEE